MATPYLRAPLIAEGQAQPHVTANNATSIADLARGRLALSATTATPPGSPVEGDAYILPTGATGWTSADDSDPAPGDIAIRWAGAWHKITPAIGWTWQILDEGASIIFTAAGWRRGSVAGPLGASLGLVVAEATLDLLGASTSAPDLLPTRAIILGVSSWTIQTVTGAPSYSVGITGEVNKFGGSLGVAVNSSNIGVVGPFATYSLADVIVTSDGADFTGGRVGLAVSAIIPGVPI
ncbi:DUF2793 domain-containing protein [Roseobacter sp. YSTF-M11]|uniref:DUF2793 domain-containing protein n=1 Tax=Roseobacter insulae TaxID=2859783 RepID=A0A9X1FXL0_9RHOB|nr:DUF2793 domain-containing protein [Roseobacter insulae]MBW4709566.1 DUF2793 domain-containing protein [Roseobacter insulae]